MFNNKGFFGIFILLAFVASCTDNPRTFTILAINDVYKIDAIEGGTIGGFARFKTLRDQLSNEDPDLITLHGGDFLSPSTLGLRYDGAQMIDVLNHIDGDNGFDDRFIVVPGNHEFDKFGDEGAENIRQRISESEFWWLKSNILWTKGTHPEIISGLEQIIPTKIIEAGGIKVGIYGLTLKRDATKYAPIDGNYIEFAKRMSSELRADGAEVIVGLHHMFVDDDIDILNQLGAEGPDIIIGGHEHVALRENVNGRWVVKADSDLYSATIARFSLHNGNLNVELENKIIDQTIAEDPTMRARVNAWISRYHLEECGATDGEQCDNTPFGYTDVELVAHEGDNRKFETNLGNFIADIMLDTFKETGKAQISFINSGGIRINRNIQAGTGLTQKLLTEILPYDPQVYLIEISGAELKAILNHSISNWPGNGYWLQVAGMAFRQNITNETVSDIMLMENNGSLRPISDDERIRAVTVRYILDTDGPQDGYKMLTQDHKVADRHNGFKLKELIKEYLLGHDDKPIAPMVEGRICQQERPVPCLLDND